MSTQPRHTLWALSIAAALTASTVSARADENASSTNAQDKEKSSQNQENAADKPVHKAKTATDRAKDAKDAKKAQDAKKAKDDKAAADKGVTPAPMTKVNRSADEAAENFNEGIVGTEAHQSNAQKARDPKLRPKDDREAKKAGEAVGRTTTTAAEVIATAVQDTTRTTDKPGPYAPLAIEVNPLGVIMGRYSAQIEWAPVTHNVILVSPHIIHTSADINTTVNSKESETFTGVGGEVGYRYYTGHRGMNGVFIGPSILVGAYNASFLGTDQTFTNIGGAVDVGFKGLIADHLALGGGVGLEYLHVSHDFGDLPTGQAAIASSGVKPRLLFEAGYAF